MTHDEFRAFVKQQTGSYSVRIVAEAVRETYAEEGVHALSSIPEPALARVAGKLLDNLTKRCIA